MTLAFTEEKPYRSCMFLPWTFLLVVNNANAKNQTGNGATQMRRPRNTDAMSKQGGADFHRCQHDHLKDV